MVEVTIEHQDNSRTQRVYKTGEYAEMWLALVSAINQEERILIEAAPDVYEGATPGWAMMHGGWAAPKP